MNLHQISDTASPELQQLLDFLTKYWKGSFEFVYRDGTIYEHALDIPNADWHETSIEYWTDKMNGRRRNRAGGVFV